MLATPRISIRPMKNQLRRLPLATSGRPMPIATAAANARSIHADTCSDCSATILERTQIPAIKASGQPVGVGLPDQTRTAVSRKPAITAKA